MFSFFTFSPRRLTAAFSSLGFFLLPSLAWAQPAAGAGACAAGTYRLLAPVGGLTECLTLTQYLSGVFLITIGIAGVLAVVMIVICGIKMMMSGSVSGKSAAKECITNAIFGLLIALGAWAILYTINPDLLKNDASLLGLPTNVTGSGTPGGTVVAGYTFNWASGPGCPAVSGTFATIVPPSNCPAGGSGTCCGYIAVPSATPVSPVGNLPPPAPPVPTPAPTPGAPTPPPPPPSTPVAGLSATNYSVSKTSSQIVISVFRSGDTTGTATIDYSTISGTAISGVHFTGVSGTLTFLSGVTTQTFSIPIISSAPSTGNTSFTVRLSNPSPGMQTGTSQATVTITQPSTPLPPPPPPPPPPGTDTIAPTVTLVAPSNNSFIGKSPAAVNYAVVENTKLLSVDIEVTNIVNGSFVLSKSICAPSTATPCPALGLSGTEMVDLLSSGNGQYSISITACDTSSLCKTVTTTVTFANGCTSATDPRCSSDYLALEACIGKPITGSCARADLDLNGVINSADMDLLVSTVTKFDMNADGRVQLTQTATNWNDTCFFYTAQDPLLPCALRVIGDITISGADRLNFQDMFNLSMTSLNKVTLSTLSTNLCSKFPCTTGGAGLGGTNQLSIYGEAMFTTFAQYDWSGDGIVDWNQGSPDMIFFESCVANPLQSGCVKADVNRDGYVTSSDMNMLSNVQAAWENTTITLSEMERIFWNGTYQPEAGIINVCMGQSPLSLLCENADLNKDGAVTSADQTLLQSVIKYDVNGDGVVTFVQTPTVPLPVNTTTLPTGPSTKFSIGNRVQATADIIVRSVAGNASLFLGSLLSGSQGSVIGGPVFVDGNWWWQVRFDSGITGWTVEPTLILATAPPAPPPAPPASGLSTKFKSGELVGATSNLNVRTTPSLTGTFLALIPPNTTKGNIVGGPVYADGYWWWQTAWQSLITGWSVENYMKEFTPPPVPVIVSPINNSYVTTQAVTIRGTMPAAEVDGTVKIWQGTTLIGSTQIGTNGGWSLTKTLTDGTYTIVAVAIDQSLNPGPTSSPMTFTVDTTPPAKPVVTGPIGVVRSPNFAITGTSVENGNTVYLYNGATGTGTPLLTTAVSGGNWTFNLANYVDNTYTFSIVERDKAGNWSQVTVINIVVDAPPPAPTITSPTSGVWFTTSSVGVSGTGNFAGDTIKLYVGATTYTTNVSSLKTWSIPLTLPDGSYSIYAVEIDPGLNVSVNSNTRSFSIDTVAPSAPTITSPANWSTINTSSFNVSGTASELGTIYVYADSTSGSLIKTIPVSSLSWSSLFSGYPNGTYTVAFVEHDPAGNIGGVTTLTVTIDAPPPPPTITSPSNGLLTNITSHTVSGFGALSGNTITLYSGSTQIGVTSVGAGNAWSIPIGPLADGTQTIYATETGPTGKVSTPSNNVTFTIDTIPPPAPTITSPLNGASMKTPPPSASFQGTGSTVGGTIDIYINGVLSGSTSIGGSLTWSRNISSIPAGTWGIYATERDPAGNTGPASGTITVTFQ